MSTTSTTTARHPLAFRDRARLRRWLWRFTLAMQDHPAREGRRIRRDLRAALLDDAERIGVDAALREIGSPLRVAADHLEALGSAGPRWNDGAVLAALLGFALPLYMWAAWAMGAIDAVGAMGGGRVELTWLGVPMTAESSDEMFGLEFTLGWQPFAVSLVLGALGFALGARIWRRWARTPIS
ncbi:hypothetical protein [Cellulomonas sp. S1-8]|uniref:hypothetical protein n=1 Tax=Cellulomonas sp. S1-8 TaxID=2904790 RepID=UPI002244CD48|nr:hypothetical protein [Cellulomonas sp. S1-8]UZN02200.1 hypothetical protein OKX07_14025 [Cellulomonas sp. S1-8]